MFELIVADLTEAEKYLAADEELVTATRDNASAGFMKIPESQISLSNDLQQTDGWGADAESNGRAN